MSAVAVELYYDDWSEERRNPDVPDIEFAAAPGKGVSRLDDDDVSFDEHSVLEPTDFSEVGGRPSLKARHAMAELSMLDNETRLFELNARDARRELDRRERQSWMEWLFG